MNKILFTITFLCSLQLSAQSFAPAPGIAGSTAIAYDSSIIVNWATGIEITRGPMDIANPGGGNASFGVDSEALGLADNGVVSLGDGGTAILSFASPIANGSGPDFAVFENGFDDNYMELGFVEVSSDGINYVRFEATSETPTDVQLTNFDFSDCRYVNNLAGKYRMLFGTPFDLEELDGTPGLDVNAITHVRIVDVVGSIDPQYGTTDAQGTLINDPYPTAFEPVGFDLDAVAVIHELPAGMHALSAVDMVVFPNPATDLVIISSIQSGVVSLMDVQGKMLMRRDLLGSMEIDLSLYPDGVYIVCMESILGTTQQRLIKQ